MSQAPRRSGRKRRRPAEADKEKEESFHRDRFHAETQRILKDLATRTGFAHRPATELGPRKLPFDGSNVDSHPRFGVFVVRLRDADPLAS
jgi:hypothetical protein